MRTVAAIVTNEGVQVAVCCPEDDLEKAAVAVLVSAIDLLSEPFGTGESRRVAAEEIGARIARRAAEGVEGSITR